MNKQELSRTIFGREVDEETLAWHLFGRPVHPASTFEKTLELFQLAGMTTPEGYPHPDGDDARIRIEYEDAAWADHSKIFGPYCPWPKPVNYLEKGAKIIEAKMLSYDEYHQRASEKQIKTDELNYPSLGKMAENLAKTTVQAISHKPASSELREKRLEVCRACPAFDVDSKRCKECGCYMPAKVVVGGDPDKLCPLKKWSNL